MDEINKFRDVSGMGLCMKENRSVLRIFDDDEKILYTYKNWPKGELLSIEGIFYLKDLILPLGLDLFYIVKKVRTVRARNQKAYEVLGISQVWGRWVVRMTVFSRYYKATRMLRLSHIASGWDGNRLLEMEGVYPLTEVCRLIPFAARQLRYLVLKDPQSKEKYGVWKDADWNRYVVDISVFGPWVKKIWLNNE